MLSHSHMSSFSMSLESFLEDCSFKFFSYSSAGIVVISMIATFLYYDFSLASF